MPVETLGPRFVDSKPLDSVTKVIPQYTQHNVVRIIGDSQFREQGWPGDGTSESPFVIEGLNITTRALHCIIVLGTTLHYVVRNCLIVVTESISDGLQLVDTANGSIENCIITGGRYGAFLSSTSDCRIANCRIADAESMGIAVFSSYRPVITNNKVFRTSRGIRFQTTVNGTVNGNSIYRSRDSGILMSHGTYNNTIFGNHIGWNGPDGQTEPFYHAADFGHNFWDNNESIGNFWTGYNGTGIYQIDGLGNASDNFPRALEDRSAPFVNTPFDLDLVEGEIPPIINWTASDEYMLEYSVLLNGIRIEGTTWLIEEIGVVVRTHGFGTYNYTIVLLDAGGLQTVDSVLVRVFIVVLGKVGTDVVAYASVIATMVVLVAILTFKKLD